MRAGVTSGGGAGNGYHLDKVVTIECPVYRFAHRRRIPRRLHPLLHSYASSYSAPSSRTISAYASSTYLPRPHPNRSSSPLPLPALFPLFPRALSLSYFSSTPPPQLYSPSLRTVVYIFPIPLYSCLNPPTRTYHVFAHSRVYPYPYPATLISLRRLHPHHSHRPTYDLHIYRVFTYAHVCRTHTALLCRADSLHPIRTNSLGFVAGGITSSLPSSPPPPPCTSLPQP
ncbi:hypothetical protein R3P38DRAFT_3241990 [Favolaschia claudopus]|uniref:Uncharacterized protein n=1 Tax=Favolaschia claudopus TaxID=2862362 RepID=A0AAV9Z5R2_9AGAR